MAMIVGEQILAVHAGGPHVQRDEFIMAVGVAGAVRGLIITLEDL